MKRLTDEELDTLAQGVAHDAEAGHEVCLVQPTDLHIALTELRERRAADLSAEDVEALEQAMRHFKGPNYEPGWNSYGHILAALSKLLDGGKP